MAMVVRLGLFFWLCTLVVGCTQSAFAGTYRVTNVCILQTNSTCVPGSAVTLTAGSPQELCGMVGAREQYENTDTYNMGGGGLYSRVCLMSKSGSEYSGCTIKANDTGFCARSRSYETVSGGESCWQSQANFGYTATPPGGCEPCTAPEIWNPSTLQCQMPPCEEGETWDEDIDACRAECDPLTEFYNYSSSSCKAQCPVGKSSPYMMISNKPVINFNGNETVNGCPIEFKFQCVPDVTPGGYYTGDNFSGKVCRTWWSYGAPVPDYSTFDLITQDEYCEETGACEGYEGEASAPNLVNVDDLANMEFEFSQLLGLDIAVDIEASHFVCLGGVYRLVTTINGMPEEVEFFGACPGQNEDFTPPGPSTNEFNARLEAKVDEVKATGDQTKTLLEAVEALVDEVKANTQQIGVAMGVLEGGEEDPPPGEFEGPDVGEGYESPYENGLDGVVQEAQDDLETTAIQEWLNGMIPVLPSDVPACPSFSFHFPILDIEREITPDCAIWDWLKAFLYLMTIAVCYGLVLARD